MTGFADSGERRRRSHGAPHITELIDEATVQGIAEEACTTTTTSSKPRTARTRWPGVVRAAGPGPVRLEHAERDRDRVPAGAAILRLGRAVRFVTSEGSPEMREKAADAGALFLIAKPFTEDTFREHLDGVIA